MKWEKESLCISLLPSNTNDSLGKLPVSSEIVGQHLYEP